MWTFAPRFVKATTRKPRSTRPWTARIFLRPAPGTGVIYEYACHEGNYAAELSLRSTRAAEARKE